MSLDSPHLEVQIIEDWLAIRGELHNQVIHHNLTTVIIHPAKPASTQFGLALL